MSFLPQAGRPRTGPPDSRGRRADCGGPAEPDGVRTGVQPGRVAQLPARRRERVAAELQLVLEPEAHQALDGPGYCRVL